MKAFFLPFARAGEKIYIKMHSTKSRFAIRTSNILSAGVYVCTFRPGIFLQAVAVKGLKAAHYYKASLTRQTHRLASLSYNRLNSTAAVYLTEVLTVYEPSRQLRSSSDTAILCLNSLCAHALDWSEIFLLRRPVCLEQFPLQS